MSLINQVSLESSTGPVHTLLNGVNQALGVTPNLMQVLANSHAALQGYLQLSGSLSKGEIHGALGEQIALAISQQNGCNYCLAAHNLIGGKMGLSEEDRTLARKAEATDPKADAILKFAAAVNEKRGHVDPSEVAALKAAGVSDGEIVETIVNVALAVLTNYTNTALQVVVDFPAAPALD